MHASYVHLTQINQSDPYLFLHVVWFDSEWTGSVKFLFVIRFDFGSNSGRHVGQNIQQNKRQDGTQVKTKDRRNEASEEVQVRIRNLEYWLQNADAFNF